MTPKAGSAGEVVQDILTLVNNYRDLSPVEWTALEPQIAQALIEFGEQEYKHGYENGLEDAHGD